MRGINWCGERCEDESNDVSCKCGVRCRKSGSAKKVFHGCGSSHCRVRLYGRSYAGIRQIRMEQGGMAKHGHLISDYKQ